jgi:hypothetical protein
MITLRVIQEARFAPGLLSECVLIDPNSGRLTLVGSFNHSRDAKQD